MYSLKFIGDEKNIILGVDKSNYKWYNVYAR